MTDCIYFNQKKKKFEKYGSTRPNSTRNPLTHLKMTRFNLQLVDPQTRLTRPDTDPTCPFCHVYSRMSQTKPKTNIIFRLKKIVKDEQFFGLLICSCFGLNPIIWTGYYIYRPHYIRHSQLLWTWIVTIVLCMSMQ